MLSSGHSTNLALMNSQQLLLPTPALPKIKIAEIPTEVQAGLSRAPPPGKVLLAVDDCEVRMSRFVLQSTAAGTLSMLMSEANKVKKVIL